MDNSVKDDTLTDIEVQCTLPVEEYIFQWHITHQCNLRCKHCYQENYCESSSYEELIEILDKYERFLKKYNYRGHIYLTGGEPLFHKDFFLLIKEIKRRGIRMCILSNGTLIGRAEAVKISAVGVDFVQVSLDGPPEIHDSIRGKGNFRKAIEGIDRLKAEGVKVLVSFTAQKNNYKSLPALARICSAHGVDKLWWDRVVTDTRESTATLALSTQEFRHISKTAARLNRFYRITTANQLVSSERSLQFLEKKDPCTVYHCKVGGNMIIVLADGSVMPCRRLPFVIGNIKECEFDDIITENTLMKELRETPPPEECKGCRHKESCHGGAKCVTYGQTGMLYARDVNCYKNCKGDNKND